jgi:hypothetical protein
MAEQEQRVEEAVPGTAAGSAPETNEPEKTEQQAAPQEDEAPKDAQAWAQMRLENKRLKEQLEQPQEQQAPRDSFRPQRQEDSVFNILPDLNTYKDPYSGEVDQGRYQAALAQYEASQSRQEAQTALERIDELETRQVIPEMADPAFEELVADKWARYKYEALQRGERPPTIKQIALDFKKNTWNALSRKQQQALVAETLEKVSEKEQASLAEIGRTGADREVQDVEELERLRQDTRQGARNPSRSLDAITERLKRIPPAKR